MVAGSQFRSLPGHQRELERGDALVDRHDDEEMAPGKQTRAEARPQAAADDRVSDIRKLRSMLGKLGGGGAPLPTSASSHFSELLGADLSSVQIHSSGPASEAAAAMGARAFTHGSHIAFAPGAYDPQSATANYVLAHELVHVVQNQRAGGKAMELAALMDIGPSGSSVETEAELGAQAVTSGQAFSVASRSSLPGISLFGPNDPPAAAPAAGATPSPSGLGVEVRYRPAVALDAIQIEDTPFSVALQVRADASVRLKSDVGPNVNLKGGVRTQGAGQPAAEEEINAELAKTAEGGFKLGLKGSARQNLTRDGGQLGLLLTAKFGNDSTNVEFAVGTVFSWDSDRGPRVSVARISVAVPLMHSGPQPPNQFFDSQHLECTYQFGPVTIQGDLQADPESLLRFLIDTGVQLGIDGACAMLGEMAVIFAPAMMAVCAITVASEEQAQLNLIAADAMRAKRSVDIFLAALDPTRDGLGADPTPAGAYGATAVALAASKRAQILAATKLDAASFRAAVLKDASWGSALAGMTTNLSVSLQRDLEKKAQTTGQQFMHDHTMARLWDGLWKDPNAPDFSAKCANEVDRVFGGVTAAQMGPPGNANIPGAAAPPVARKANGDGVEEGAEQAVATAATSGGSSLPEQLRERLEASLGADLGGVKVHTGSASATAAHAVGARAYAVGQDIHFGAGNYDPSSQEGQSLIAHEVAHTVQQRGTAGAPQHKLEVSSPGDAHEVEADSFAQSFVSGGSVFSQLAARPTTVSRKAPATTAHKVVPPSLDMFKTAVGSIKKAGSVDTVEAVRNGDSVLVQTPGVSMVGTVVLKDDVDPDKPINAGWVQTVENSRRITIYEKDGKVVGRSITAFSSTRDGKSGVPAPWYEPPQVITKDNRDVYPTAEDQPKMAVPNKMDNGELAEIQGSDDFKTSLEFGQDATSTPIKTFAWSAPWSVRLGKAEYAKGGDISISESATHEPPKGTLTANEVGNQPDSTFKSYESEAEAIAGLGQKGIQGFIKDLPKHKALVPTSYWFMVGALWKSNAMFRVKITPIQGGTPDVTVSIKAEHSVGFAERAADQEFSALAHMVYDPAAIAPGHTVMIMINGTSQSHIDFPYADVHEKDVKWRIGSTDYVYNIDVTLS